MIYPSVCTFFGMSIPPRPFFRGPQLPNYSSSNWYSFWVLGHVQSRPQLGAGRLLPVVVSSPSRDAVSDAGCDGVLLLICEADAASKYVVDSMRKRWSAC
jgi:hypothetical protein